MADCSEHPGVPLLPQEPHLSTGVNSNGNITGCTNTGMASSAPVRPAVRNRTYHHAYSCRGSRTNAQEMCPNSQYTAVLQALVSPPNAISVNDNNESAGVHQQEESRKPQQPMTRKPRRGIPLVQWVWPSTEGPSGIPAASFNRTGEVGNVENAPRREPNQCSPQEPQKQSLLLQARVRKPSTVVIGKICEPVRPTRLDLRASGGYPRFSRVIFTAKGGYTNLSDAVNHAPSGTRSSSLKFTLPSPHEAPWLDSTGTSGGGGAEGGGRSRAHSANSAAAAGLQSPRYLRSTNVSQAKAVEPGESARVAGRNRVDRSSRRSGMLCLGMEPGTPVKGSGRGNGYESDGAASSGGWGASGMLGSLGGFLGIRKGSADGAYKEMKRGKTKRPSRTEVDKAAARVTHARSKLGSKVMQRLRGPSDGEGRVTRKGSFRKAPRVGAAKASGTEEVVTPTKSTRRDEREILTVQMDGVLRPEGLKLRVVKASGRTLEETKFHMEIRTQRPGQVWSVCRRLHDFQKLHACLQGRFPALVLPRLPRPPSGGGVLDPATLERTRAGLQSFLQALVADVPVVWIEEEFVMFLDSDEKGRRLFARKRKKATRRVTGRLPVPGGQESKSSSPAGAEFSELEASPPGPAHENTQKSLLEQKVEEKKKAMAELEDAAQNHFEGVGAVMNAEVSFSDDEDLGFDDDGEFIDGEDAIRAMLDRDAKEAEDDNLFNIPAGTEFDANLDDDDEFGDDDDFDIDYHG